MSDDLHEAINQAIADYYADQIGDSVIVTKWVAVCEYVTPDNSFRTMTTIGSDELSSWDAVGMLEMAAAGNKADYAAHRRHCDDEDD